MTDYLFNTIIVVLLVLALVLIVLAFWRRRHRLDSLDLKVLSIKIPRAAKENEKDFLQRINLSEQLFASLSALNRPLVFEVAVRNGGEEIAFYLAVPRGSLDFAKKQIQGLFLDAKVEEAVDYTIFEPRSFSAAGYLTQDKHYILPVTTYREAEADIFSPILNTLSELKGVGEGACLQFIFKPAGELAKKNVLKILGKLKEGKLLKDVLTDRPFSAKEFKKALEGEVSESKEKNPLQPRVLDEEAIKAVQLKLAKPLLNANIRLVASAESRDRAEDIFLALAGAFGKFSSPMRNSFKIIKPRQTKRLLFQYIFREYDLDQLLVLNTEELASVFHLPTYTSDIPNIAWLRAKEAPPPESIPTGGLIIGESVFRGSTKTIRLTDDDRRRHLYMVGQTGTGKSTFILNMAIQDMAAGHGFGVIDPHGELIDKILSFVPANRIDDVIVFDPGDRERPLGLNMLEYNQAKPEEKTFIVNEMQAIFNQLFQKETMGPMFEKYMRGALLLLMEDAANEPATLMEVPRIFTDEEYRHRKLARVTNPAVIDFWTKEVPKVTGEAGLGNMAPYITSKFDNFISNDYLRPIIGQPHSAFNFRQAMDEGKIILVNLSKGKVGDINSSLLGMVMVGKILQAALSRVDIADEASRRDFYLYIDEFQNYTTESIATILSEARKYRLNLIIAHQFIAQLKDNIRESVFGNVGNLVAFRVGPPDAEVLVKHFSPTFDEKDLIGIENLNAYAKILVDGQPSTPFNLKMTWPIGGSIDIQDKMKELSRLKYGQDLQTVENNIIKRLRN